MLRVFSVAAIDGLIIQEFQLFLFGLYSDARPEGIPRISGRSLTPEAPWRATNAEEFWESLFTRSAREFIAHVPDL